uniref:Major facilitator superfamily domain-containing protein 6-like protein B n=1 Tax=Callorhinchus milii TaxID=7868 RepID=V9KLI8_CALMI
MKRNKQWNVNKALALASLFHFLHCAGKACVVPFLTIYFRQLGLTAPFVGIIMGTKYFISLVCAPFWSYCARRHNMRRVLVLGSLLSSIGAGLLLTLISPVDKEAGYKFCNGSVQTGHSLADGGTTVKKVDFEKNNIAHTTSPTTTYISSRVIVTTKQASVTFPRLNLTGVSVAHRTEWSRSTVAREISLASAYTSRSTSKKAHYRFDSKPSQIVPDAESSGKGRSLLPADGQKRAKKGIFSGSGSNQLVQRNIGLDNDSRNKQKMHDQSLEPSSLKILDIQHQTFVLILLTVSLWELLASTLEWVADDGLYDYLDFVDSVDRYGKQWIWGSLGTAVAACSVGIFVDRLNCFLNAHTSRTAVHFYSYAVVITLALLVGVFYPNHTPKKSGPVNRTVKGLYLIGSDGRAILYAVTVFVTGAVGSTVNNFLFWQIQNNGGTETYMGISVAIAVIAEILLFVFKEKMLRSLSLPGVVGLGLFSLAAQFLYYSFLWTSWAVLPIQILNAFSNGALWWAVHAQSADLATPGMERTLHKVFHGLSFGLGASSGSFASGFIVDNFNLAILYQSCSAVAVLWTLVFLAIQSRIPRQKRLNYSRLLAADTSDMSDSEDEPDKDWLVKALKNDDFL